VLLRAWRRAKRWRQKGRKARVQRERAGALDGAEVAARAGGAPGAEGKKACSRRMVAGPCDYVESPAGALVQKSQFNATIGLSVWLPTPSPEPLLQSCP
jgi:hypothetical protein